MKMKFDRAVIMNDPNKPKPLAHESICRRVIAPGVSDSGWSTTFFIGLLLLRRVDQIFQVRPEHLEFALFDVLEIVLLDRKHEDQGRSDPHAKTGENGNPCNVHGNLAAFRLRPMLAGRKTRD